MDKLNQIQKQLAEHSTEEAKQSSIKFVPGLQKVYGVRMPVINALAKSIKDADINLVKELWQSGAFEEKILAGKLIAKFSKKQPLEALKLVADFSNEITDWAVCDTLGMQSLKPIAKTFQSQIFALAHKLNRSKNLWQRRLSLVLVEVYTKDKSFHDPIKELVIPLKSDKEYYVKKSVEWLERNLKKHA